MRGPVQVAPLTDNNLMRFAPSEVPQRSGHHRSVVSSQVRDSIHTSHKSRYEKSSRRSVHDRIKSHQSNKSSHMSQKPIRDDNHQQFTGVRVKNFGSNSKPGYSTKCGTKMSEFGLSSLSHQSQESNGFHQTMTKPFRIYNDGRATYYTGRMHITQKPSFDATSSKTFNRTLRDRDTFLTVFPNYRISRDSKHSTMQRQFRYPKKSIEGSPMHQIDRTYTHKNDTMKKYTEEMLKVASMKRQIK